MRVLDDAHGRVLLGESYVALQLPAAQRVLSFALHNGGFHTARTIAIHEVRNADLPPELDPLTLLSTRMRDLDAQGVGMLTSRRVSAMETVSSERDGVFARAVVTAGLSNALRVGDAPGPLDAWGTINVIAQISTPLTEHALIEALSIVAEARTSVVCDAHVPSRRSGQPATGTGTDCIAVVAPPPTAAGQSASDAERYAGKHTLVGHMIGDVVRRALETAITRWKEEYWR